MVRLSIEPRHLEELLEALAALDFPVNPALFHWPGSVTVEFPAYAAHAERVKAALEPLGFGSGCLEVFGMLTAAAVAGG